MTTKERRKELKAAYKQMPFGNVHKRGDYFTFLDSAANWRLDGYVEYSRRDYHQARFIRQYYRHGMNKLPN